MKKKIIAKISSLLCMTMVVTGVYTPMIPVYAALKDDIKLCDDKVESHPITEDSKALVEETQVLSDTDDDIISVAEEEKELSLVKGVPETVYTVRLKTDESYSTSDPIYFYSNSSSIAASKEEAGSAQFYRADGGKLGFKLPDDYLPTSFEVKPYEDDNKTHYDYIFNGWSTVEGCTPDGTGCYILNSQTLTFITKWKQSQNQGLWLYERNSSNTKCIITDFNESTKSRQYYSDLVIPSHIDGMEVTDIQMSLESFKNINNLYLFEDSCFDKMPIISNQYLQHINIIDARGVVIKKDCLPDSVKTIVGNGLGIHILKKLTLPGVIRVETRRKGAFEGNISLESVIFKKTAAIDADAFSNINHELSISYPGSCSDWPYEIYRNSRGISVNCLDGTCGWCGADNSNNNTHWIMDNAGNLTIDSFGSNPDLYEQYKKYQVPYKGN